MKAMAMIKFLLNYFGLSVAASRMKSQGAAWMLHLLYRVVLITRSTRAYFRYFDLKYKSLLNSQYKVFGVAADRYESFRIVFENLLLKKKE